MTLEHNKALARRELEELWSEGNLAVADEIFAPNFVSHQHSRPDAQDVRGVAAYKAFVRQLHEAFPDLHYVLEDQIAEADKVMTRNVANLSHKGGNWSGWSGANLRAANLGHAWLRDANLRRARHVTDEQLEKAETLAGATMPDGQTLKGGLLGDEAPNGPTFEEWLKDKKAQGKDEKNK